MMSLKVKTDLRILLLSLSKAFVMDFQHLSETLQNNTSQHWAVFYGTKMDHFEQ